MNKYLVTLGVVSALSTGRVNPSTFRVLKRAGETMQHKSQSGCRLILSEFVARTFDRVGSHRAWLIPSLLYGLFLPTCVNEQLRHHFDG
jgi:hypothetical protein